MDRVTIFCSNSVVNNCFKQTVFVSAKFIWNCWANIVKNSIKVYFNKISTASPAHNLSHNLKIFLKYFLIIHLYNALLDKKIDPPERNHKHIVSLFKNSNKLCPISLNVILKNATIQSKIQNRKKYRVSQKKSGNRSQWEK